MAESVDALVSNTSGAIRAGSTPALGTASEMVRRVRPRLWVRRRKWFAEVRSLCERRRLTFPPFPQNLLQSFLGPH